MFLFKSQPTRFIFLYFTSVGFFFFFTLPLTFRFCPVAISRREGGGIEGGKKGGLSSYLHDHLRIPPGIPPT